MRERLILQRFGIVVLACALTAFASGCGTHQSLAPPQAAQPRVAATTSAPTSTLAPAATTTTPPTTAATTTTPATTATTAVPTTTSSIAETTTSAALPAPIVAPIEPAQVFIAPVPVAAPADATAAEPVVQLGSIEIPKLGVTETMYEGIRLTTLDRGPGHWPGTPQPGEVGNMVIGGHRVSHTKPFRHVDQLVAGDEVIFTNDTGRYVYKVTSTEIVSPSESAIVLAQTPAKTATLFACHPPGSTRQRIVVHLELSA